MVIAMTDRARHETTLYRIDEHRRAVRLRTLVKPAWADYVGSIQLTSGPDPSMCLVSSAFTADSEFRHEVRCFAPGDESGKAQPLSGKMQIALSRDGRTLISVSDTALDARVIEVSTLHDGRSTVRGRVVITRDNDETAPDCPTVDGVTWAGDADLLLQCVPDADTAPNVIVQNLDALLAGAPPGAGKALRPTGPLAKGYDSLSHVMPLDAETAVAVMSVNISCPEGEPCPGTRPEPKAVRLNLHTGHVLEVVATALPDRRLTGVGGGADGLVYVTEDTDDKRVYVRWPGERHGALVSGLPAVFDQVIAQH